MARGAWTVVAMLAVACGGDGGDGLVEDARPPDAAPDAPGCTAESCDGCCMFDQCFAADSPVCAVDACNGVGPEGVCESPTRVAWCLGTPESGTSALRTHDCRPGEMCQETDDGAGCVLVAACRDGETRCLDAGTPQVCVGGQWQSSACATTCIASSLGARCASTVATRALTGTLRYEMRGLDASPPTDWGALTAAPAGGFEVLAVRMPESGPLELVGVTVTAADGNFALDVPLAATADDRLVFVAAATGTAADSGATIVEYAVADPGLPAGPASHEVGTIGAARPWSWSTPIDSFTGTHVIRDSDFSGAAHLFHHARTAAAAFATRFDGNASFAIWLSPGVEWTCGTCHVGFPVTGLATTFAHNIFFRADSDEPYWSDSVVLHELGHVAMAAFGRAVGEGGRHCFSVATAPGLAWSEGYATWFSADLRGDPRYVDRQGGTLFWFDLGARVHSAGTAWPRPVAAAGLEQDLYENEVAAMLWALTTSGAVGRAALDSALVSPRLRTPPFERGYTRQTWLSGSACERTSIIDTGVSTTHLADLLDALVCSGTSPAVIDAVTDPAVRYPYPSSAPLCRNPPP